MNHYARHSSPNDPKSLDLLVDGELDEPARRELLVGLDREPDGWRRCALAFLEAQTWKSALGSMVEERPAEVAPAPAKRPRFAPSWFKTFGAVVAMAASFLIAFNLGTNLRDSWVSPPLGESPQSLSGMMAAVDPLDAPYYPQAVAVPQGPNLAAVSESPLGSLTLSFPCGPGRDAVTLPVVSQADYDPRVHGEQVGMFPAEWVTKMAEIGIAIDQNRHYEVFSLDDGRQVVVPIDQVEMQLVNNRTYQ